MADTEDLHPTDVVMDAEGCWRVLWSDGSLGPALTLDEMLDVLPYLRGAIAPDR
jgi:hypothetical protein